MAAGGKGSPKRFRLDAAAGAYENMGEDPMHPLEHKVIDLWEAGLSFDDIALRSGMSRTSVINMVSYLDDRPDPRDAERLRRQRDACAELAARIRQFFPHIALAPTVSRKA